jgi:UTP--glucose-1-phosphate uridylyltransferase
VPAITDAVIPVAGLGTRLLPATRSQPKEMLPLVDKPVVQYVVEELVAAGITRVLFVTGRRKRAIEDHFDADPELERAVGAAAGSSLGVEVLYTRQPRPAGLGDALARAASFAAGRPVVVALGDSLIEPANGAGPGVVHRLIDAYELGGAGAAIAVNEVASELVPRYGIAVPRAPTATSAGPFELASVVEKPRADAVSSRWAVMARYVLGPGVFEALAQIGPDDSGEVQLADALKLVLAAGERVLAVPLAPGERRHDIGSIESYCATFLRYALTDPRFGPQLRAQAVALLNGT